MSPEALKKKRRNRKRRPTAISKTKEQFDALVQRYEALRLQFINTELDLAITFSQRALSAGTRADRMRNLTHARIAFASASHFLTLTQMPDERCRNLVAKFRELRALLDQAGSRKGA